MAGDHAMDGHNDAVHQRRQALGAGQPVALDIEPLARALATMLQRLAHERHETGPQGRMIGAMLRFERRQRGVEVERLLWGRVKQECLGCGCGP